MRIRTRAIIPSYWIALELLDTEMQVVTATMGPELEEARFGREEQKEIYGFNINPEE